MGSREIAWYRPVCGFVSRLSSGGLGGAGEDFWKAGQSSGKGASNLVCLEPRFDDCDLSSGRNHMGLS